MEWTISTSLPINYNIKTSVDLFSPDNTDITSYCNTDRSIIVIDKKVHILYGDKIEQYFISNNIKYRLVIIDGIESNKDLKHLTTILTEMEHFGISRNSDPIIGIGGGVIQDLVGMAASMYRRGVPYIRIPTTLIGIVDVSVAAKTGINFESRRNRLGTYYPPIVSILDSKFISTLDTIEISSGLGEIIKMAIIKDYELFKILEKNGSELLSSKFDNDTSEYVINASIQGMKDELEPNLWEKNLKRCVDFGHSFSPIIEMRSLTTDHPLTHGQAVTLDIIISCAISNMKGLMSDSDVNRIINVAHQLGLDTWNESFANPELLLESLHDTVKHRGGNQNLPIPVGIGEYTFLNDLTYSEICDTVKIFNNINGK